MFLKVTSGIDDFSLRNIFARIFYHDKSFPAETFLIVKSITKSFSD
ncbi:hypothetical protein HMPREF0378_0913 [Eubacterium nodatum ATCC 33099]|nr:hypothetical protein HMPREF0378_0913 [Eubacterium nodatum ATCC 33099]